MKSSSNLAGRCHGTLCMGLKGNLGLESLAILWSCTSQNTLCLQASNWPWRFCDLCITCILTSTCALRDL